MKNNNINNHEAFFKTIINHDELSCEPDPSIRLRLTNYMNLQNRNRPIQKNSYFSLLLSFFTPQHIGFKAALVSFAIFLSFMFGNYIHRNNPDKNSNSMFYTADSFNIQSYDSSFTIIDTSKIKL